MKYYIVRQWIDGDETYLIFTDYDMFQEYLKTFDIWSYWCIENEEDLKSLLEDIQLSPMATIEIK